MRKNVLDRQYDLTTPLEILVNRVIEGLMLSTMDSNKKEFYTHKLKNLDFEILADAYLSTLGSISQTNIKYAICFFIDMKTQDIAQLFNVTQASVRTVKYRIRKKFGKNNIYRLLL